MNATNLGIKTLKGVDLSGMKTAVIDGDIPADATIGEIVSEMTRAMSLPRDTTYHAEYQGRRLNRSETVMEAGLEDDAEIRLHPEVTAGISEA